MIKIENVVKKYNQNIVLDNISIVINKGDIFGLVGTSGAGKSTILKIINGLESVNKGKVIVDNIDVTTLNREDKRIFQKRIGMIFQNFALLERKNVFDNVAFPLQCAKCSKEAINKKVEYLLKKVGIFEKRNAMPSELSGGQRQRVAIARALSLDPNILLCDEATSGLDPKTTTTILDLLVSINNKDNITIIIVTHEMEVVEKICDNVAIIENGLVKANGLVEDVLSNYSNRYQIVGINSFSNNIYLKIQYHNTKENNNLLSKIALENNLLFSIEDSNTQYLKNYTISNFIIKIISDDLVKLENYLINKNIQYSIMKGKDNHATHPSK